MITLNEVQQTIGRVNKVANPAIHRWAGGLSQKTCVQ